MRKPTYGATLRLHFIETMLIAFGRANRKALIHYFGISEPCATKDFTRYRKLAPQNLVFDQSSKTYLKTPNFKSIFDQ